MRARVPQEMAGTALTVLLKWCLISGMWSMWSVVFCMMFCCLHDMKHASKIERDENASQACKWDYCGAFGTKRRLFYC